VREIKLYNFDVGNISNYNRPQFENMRFGALSIRFRDDYTEQIAYLQQPALITQNLSWSKGKPSEITEERTPSKFTSGFIHTADIVIDENADERQKSILLASPLEDDGIFDFIELATFFSGRRVVATDSDMGRYYTDIQKKNNDCAYPLTALFHAWNNRHLMLKSGISIALHILNSTRSGMLQSLVYHYASAMDIIQTQMYRETECIDISKSEKTVLKKAICALLDGCTFYGLSSEDISRLKEAYKNILSARIDEGSVNSQGKLFIALRKLGILEGEFSNASEATRNAIRIVNLQPWR